MHTVKKPFSARQYRGALAVGVKYVAMTGKDFYRFKIEGAGNVVHYFSIPEAIRIAKDNPPPGNSKGNFLFKDMLIVPLSICLKEEDAQKVLF